VADRPVWRFWAVATALNRRFHFVFCSSPGASGAFSGTIRFGISAPVTASGRARQMVSTAAAENDGSGKGADDMQRLSRRTLVGG
jgi:hypothetical protein